MDRRYIPGMIYEIGYGGPWGSDSCLVTLYGDMSHPSAQYAMDAATATHPDEASLTDHQKVAVNFRFGEPRPYGNARELFDRIAGLLEAAGWTLAPVIEGLPPDSGSSIDDLVENPEWPKIEGLDEMTGANGFTLIIEKVGTKPVFTSEEIESIRQLATQSMLVVFGRELSLEE